MRPEPEPSRSLDGSVFPVEVHPAEGARPGSPPATPPHHEGARYELGPLIGRGGMGDVHLARDRWLDREVASKSARDPADARLEAAILREARIAGRLDHPAIVPVYDLGRAPSGALAYTMRVVRGEPLADRLRRSSPPSRVPLVRSLLEVARAIAHAHARGVVHRDLKPANVVLGEYGETQVIDWGLAVELDAAVPEAARGAGTPRYMSPEQARGEPAHPDDDVWALGAILYELLAGKPPFHELDHDRALLEALRAGRAPDLGALRAAPPELVGLLRATFAPRGLRRDARAFVEDLERYLDARPLLGHDYSPLDHVRRLWRAWRTPIIVGLFALAALLVVIVVAIVDTAAERDRARAAEAQAERNLALSLEREVTGLALDGARPAAEALARTASPNPALRGALASLTAPPPPEPVEVLALPRCDRLALDPEARWAICLDNQGISAQLRDRPHDAFMPAWSRPEPFVDAVVLAPAGEVVATRADDTTARLDLWTGAPLASLPFSHLRNLEASADGRVLLAHENHYLQRWDPLAGAHDRVPACSLRTPIVAFAASADGVELAALCEDGALERFSLAPGRRVQHAPVATPFGAGRPEASALAFVGEARLVVATRRGGLALVDASTGALLLEAVAGSGPVARLTAARDRVAVEDAGSHLRLWSPATGSWLAALPDGGHRHGVRLTRAHLETVGDELVQWRTSDEAALIEHPVGISALAVSPDGRRVAVGDRSGITIRDRATGHIMARREVPGRMVKALHLDERGVVAVSAEAPAGFSDLASPMARAWADLPPARRVAPLGEGYAVAPYGEALLVVHPDGRVERVALSHELVDLAASPDRRWLALVDRAGLVSAVTTEATTPSPIAALPEASVVLARAAPGVALAASRLAPEVLELPSRRVVAALQPGAVVTRLALSPDERWLAVGTLAGRLEVFDAAGHLALTFPAHTERVSGLAFVPGADELVTAGWDGRVRRFDLRHLLDLLDGR